MSYKATAFSFSIVPKTQSRFLVFIPGILNSPLRVHQTTMPQETVDVVPLNIAGQTVNMPGKDQYSGKWSCTAYESILTDLRLQISLLKDTQINKNAEYPNPFHMVPNSVSRVEVDTKQLMVNLSTFWNREPEVQSRGVNLMEPLIFLMDESTGLVPVQVVKLVGAFLTGVDEVSLDWSKPAQPLSYKLNFAYTSIQHLL